MKTISDDESRLKPLKKKIRRWKKEGYNVEELESKIDNVETQSLQNEVQPSISPVRSPRTGYILGTIAFFVIITIIAGGIYSFYIADNNDTPNFFDDVNIFDDYELTPVDSDGDGVDDENDAFPYDSSEWKDSDNDGVGDNFDKFRYDATESKDSDGDGYGDNSDDFPDDYSEHEDSDNDGVGNNGDAFPYDFTETKDSDNDGVGDNDDVFPYNSNEQYDYDSDGVGDNSDIYPYDSTQWADRDGDGYGDNPAGNNPDAFPDDSTEWLDSDNDGYGDNSDIFPYDQSEWKDNDGDGMGDNEDNDDDNDGYFDYEDYLPYEDAEIQIDLIKFIVKDEVDGWPDDNTKAQIYFEIYINDVKVARSPQEGYVWNADVGITETINWDFTFNIPDNSQTHSISIRMYDSDLLWGEQLDIDGHDDSRGCTITYDIVGEYWYGDDSDGITDGSDDGTQYSDDDDAYLEYKIEMI